MTLKVDGFKAGAVKAGIKYPDRLDLGVIIAEQPARAAGLFTRNRIKAPSVLLAQRRIERGELQAVIVNSGNANACVGPAGMTATTRITDAVAKAASIEVGLVAMNSTGVIGEPLPEQKIIPLIPGLLAAAREDGFEDFTRAIMTTDTRQKTARAEVEGAAIIGVCKGSGMIMPDMATMLAYILTDADLAAAELDDMLRKAARDSFNALTVDGDTSTNDSVIMMASAKKDVSNSRKAFQKALSDLCLDLAQQIAADGEGATRMYRVKVDEARNAEEADRVARRVANSLLIKTAFHAADPNWGRIMAAVGSAGAGISPLKIKVSLVSERGTEVKVVENCAPHPSYKEEAAKLIIQDPVFTLRIKLGRGKASRSIFTCDLSADYVKINADYRS